MSDNVVGTVGATVNTDGIVGGTVAIAGGGGTSNYNDLINKPSINGVTLSGNKTLSDLGAASLADVAQSVDDALQEAKDSGEFDGPPGPRGESGATGPQGPAGVGVPAGGSTGQVLAKRSGTDYDTEWVNQSGGGGGGAVDDVKVNGNTVVIDGVANVPLADTINPGVVRIPSGTNASIDIHNGTISVRTATPDAIKYGTNDLPIGANVAKETAFYGLASAAGDTSQKQSVNPVGTYTNGAKQAIKTMLGINDTTSYNTLTNKPSINGVTLSGNKTLSDLGAASAADVTAKYTKPSGGIPASDLASAVQISLDKADTALQTAPVTSVNGQTGAVVLNAADVGAGTYSKPSGGIPASDLASSVQTSLGKADTALQTAPVTSVAGRTGAVTLDAGDVEYDDTDTYAAGTVGAGLAGLKSQIQQKIDEPQTEGTSGQVLTTDGNGGRSWTTVQGGGGSVTVDTELSTVSTNPVQNKVITAEINDLDEAVFSTGTGSVVAPDLFSSVTDTDMQLAIDDTSFSQGSTSYGFYINVSDYRGQELMIKREQMFATLRGVFTQNVPAVGVTFSIDNKWNVNHVDKKGVIVTVPNDPTINYLYIIYYNSSNDTGTTKQQALAGMEIYQPDATDYYSHASEEMMLAFTDGTFTQASSLYGFYVPVAPSSNMVMVARTNIGSRFRFGFSVGVPAIGVSYLTYDSGHDTTDTAWLAVPSGANYLYIAYYRTSDTMTKEQLRAGMTVRYDIPAQISAGKRIDRINRLDHSTGVSFVNGSINSSGVFSEDNTHITSDFVQVEGEFYITCPSDYVMSIHLFNDEYEYVSTTEKTDGYYKFSNLGFARFTIRASDNSDITPSAVDFSQIKIPTNRYSALSHTNRETFVLDAENIKAADVFDYIDDAVSSHGMYATKTLLCNESTGLPVYYYTLGSGTKKICLVGGQHGASSDGDPRDGVIVLAKMIHDLIEGDFVDGSFLQKIHDEYTLLVIPVLNVYGFNNRRRENATNTDINRDWITSPTTIEVTAAKALIDTFAADIVLDVHTNGTTPIVNEDIEIQFGLGSHNTVFKAAVQNKFKSYYDTDVLERIPNSTSTLQYYIINTLQALGGLLELRWWIKSKKAMHDSQAESSNYAMLVNVLKYLDSVENSGTYTWEHTPNQSQY